MVHHRSLLPHRNCQVSGQLPLRRMNRVTSHMHHEYLSRLTHIMLHIAPHACKMSSVILRMHYGQVFPPQQHYIYVTSQIYVMSPKAAFVNGASSLSRAHQVEQQAVCVQEHLIGREGDGAGNLPSSLQAPKSAVCIWPPVKRRACTSSSGARVSAPALTLWSLSNAMLSFSPIHAILHSRGNPACAGQ